MKSIFGNALVDRLIGLLEKPRMVHAFRGSQAFSGMDIHQLLNELLRFLGSRLPDFTREAVFPLHNTFQDLFVIGTREGWLS